MKKAWKIGKGAVKLTAGACVDGFIAGVTASVVPLAMVCPVVGAIIVAGAAVAGSAFSSQLVDPWVDEVADSIADEMKEAKRCVDVLRDKDEETE